MITSDLFIYILVIHFLADFALQTHEQAVNKSVSDKWLVYHVSTYSLVWLLFSLGIFHNFVTSLLFAMVTFMAHFVTDYITSRIGKVFWDKGDTHNGFVVVGFDQVLHYVQLYFTILWLI